MSSQDYEVDQSDELLMHTFATLPSNTKKFWKKRHKIFSKFDEGIYMTLELWYSVTPEASAKYVAKLSRQLLEMIGKNTNESIIVDLCCGGGGNAIQFAQEFNNKILAIDINETNIHCTMHNSEIYNVSDKIIPITGDWFKLWETPEEWMPIDDGNKTIDLMFCSPPWGGPEYMKTGGKHIKFNLIEMQPMGIDKLISTMINFTKNIILFLPKNSDLHQLSEINLKYFGCDSKCKVIFLKEDGHLIGLIAIFGDISKIDIVHKEFCIPYDEY